MNKNIFKGLFAALLCMATVFSYAQTNQRYYWVGQGDNGNWGNLENWAFVSGGSIHPAIVPGATNTVVFDANSGLTPTNKTINVVGFALCDSLIIEASVAVPPVFNFANNSSSNRIQISGSFLNYGWATSTGVNGSSVFFLSSRQNESVLWNNFYVIAPSPSDDYPMGKDINFVGTGKWTLLSDVYLGGFFVNNGTVDFNGYNLGVLQVNVQAAGKIIFAHSYIVCGSWVHFNTSTTALTEAESEGSLIRVSIGSFDSRNLQVYNNVEFVKTNTNTIVAGKFNKITIHEGPASIGASVGTYECIIDSLIINTTREVKFGRVTVNELFQAKPTTCGGQVMLSSNSNTTKNTYFLQLNGAVVDVQRAIIYNLTVSGTQLYAVNSYDWGGNSGSIAFTAPATGREMYWIGGTGYWNDPAHWSLSSGGTTAGCIPTLADDVFFDNKSGTINVNSAISYYGTQGYCHNMTVSGITGGGPAFTMSMIIGGSLTAQANSGFYDQVYTFVSNSPETIDFNGNTSTNTRMSCHFRSVDGNGHWKFTSNFNLSASTIVLARGSLDMSGLSDSKVYSFYSMEDNTALGWLSTSPSRYFDISNSTITTTIWHSTGGQVVAADKTDNSLLRNLQNTDGFVIQIKNGDTYHNVERNYDIGTGAIIQATSGGNAYFNKVTLNTTSTYEIGYLTYANLFVTIDSLVFLKNARLTLHNDFAISKYLGSPDDCSVQPTINVYQTTPYTIIMGTANPSKADRVKLYNTIINNVSISTSEGDYDVTNCTLQGTSNGWNTTENAAQTLYWVGGEGDWSDSKHWSQSSGLSGGAYDDGTGCVPSYRDNVVFDNGSFPPLGAGTVQKVNLDINAICNNMTWLQTEDCGFMPRLAWNAGGNLSIRGSLELQKTMQMGSNSSGSTYITSIGFESARPNETIKTNGFVNYTSINEWWAFRGQGTTYTFLDDLNGTTSLLINVSTGYNTTLDMSGKNITCGYINANNNNVDISNATLQTNAYFSISGVLQADNATVRTGSYFEVRIPVATNIHLENANIYAASNVIIYNTPSLINNIYLTGSVAHSVELSNNVINKLQIEHGNAIFHYNFTTDTLMLANDAGNIYTFISGQKFTVNKAYYGSGTPCNPIYLRSSTEAGHAIFDFKRATANYDNVFATDWADTLLIDYAYIHGIEAKTNDNNAMLIKGIHAPDQEKSGVNEAGWGYGDGSDNNNVAWAAAQPFVNNATPFPAELDLPCTAWGSKFSCKTYFLPNYASTFKWRKGTKDSPVVSEEIYVVLDEEAQYVCTVDYGNGCTSTDSVNILMTPADTLVWVGANKDYYNLANWTIRNNGLPAVKLPDGCTDVYIPAGLTNYPDLSPGITNYGQEFYEIAAAKNIWFEHGGDAEAGGELVRPDSLHYAKAFANIRVKPLRWYNLTAPFRDMYSGDFAFDRINPLVEMRLFKTESPQNGEMAVADWTTPFSTDTVRLNTADGFSVRVGSVYYPDDQFWPDKDWGLMEGATSITLTDTVWQFPKDNLHWDFYHERTKEKVGQAQDLPVGGRNYTGKFTFESDLGSDLVTKTIPTGYATREVIIGNPFMSHFDFAEFYYRNHGIILPQFYLLGAGGSYQTFLAYDEEGGYDDGYFDASPAAVGNPIIAPMQSIIVTLRDEFNIPTWWDQYIAFTNIMSISNTTPSGILRKPTLTENRLASISASRGLYSSEAFVQTSQEAHNAFAEGEDALLLKSEGLSNLAIDVFTVADGKYLSVNRINEEFDTIHIGLMTKSNKGLTMITLKDIPTLSEDEQYFFEDKALAMTLPITDNIFTYEFDNQVGNVLGRFAIYKTPAIVNGVQDPKVTDNGAQAFIYGDMLNVVSKDGSAIQAIMIYDTKGVLIYENQNVNSTSWQMPAAKVGSQVLIVKVVTTNGAYAIKVIND